MSRPHASRQGTIDKLAVLVYMESLWTFCRCQLFTFSGPDEKLAAFQSDKTKPPRTASWSRHGNFRDMAHQLRGVLTTGMNVVFSLSLLQKAHKLIDHRALSSQ